MPTKKILIENADHALTLFGHEDTNLKMLENKFKVHVYVKRDRDSGDIALVLRGPQKRINDAMRFLSELEHSHSPQEYHPRAPEYGERNGSSQEAPAQEASDVIYTAANGKAIRAKTPHQQEYVDAMRQNDLVVGIGPAGTGKTFLAVAYALRCLKEKKVSRLILTRPVVEAGEKLGFLPGDLYEKVYPYLKPMYDSLFYLLGPEKFKSLQVTEVIEVAPLAYMRGRTLEDAFIILDEAQNATMAQMKMFLTRMGMGSKVVVTGDVTQVDLDKKNGGSGLAISEEILSSVEGVGFIHLTEEDVVRHALVRRVIRAYENFENKDNPPVR